jgi:hypothetical protein
MMAILLRLADDSDGRVSSAVSLLAPGAVWD